MKNKILTVLSLVVLLPLAANAQLSTIDANNNVDLPGAFSSLQKLHFTPAKITPVSLTNPISWFQKFLPGGQTAHLESVIKKVTPGTVTISIKAIVQESDPDSDTPGSISPVHTMDAVGSGFIIGKDSAGRPLIITNAHVVDIFGRNGKASVEQEVDGQSVSVPVDVLLVQMTVTSNADGSTYPATLIGYSDKERGYDLALVRLNSACAKCTVLAMATTADIANTVKQGEPVIAIGAPYDLGDTMTHGIVSNVNRNGIGADLVSNYIQTDASINPGNSGGPLFDADSGKVIGINESIFSPNGGSVGIGFAIPIEFAKAMFARYNATGVFDSSDTGLTTDKNFKITALNGNLKYKGSQELAIGDVILSVNGRTFKSTIELMRYLADEVPGKSQTVFSVLRGTTPVHVTADMEIMN